MQKLLISTEGHGDDVVNDLQSRGGWNIFIVCMDGLSGFKNAVLASYPQSRIPTGFDRL